MKDDQIFFVGQKAFIENEGKLLVLFNDKNRVDFPGGKIQTGELDLEASLKREVLEETGLEVDVQDPMQTWIFDLPAHHPHAGKKVFLVGYQCKLRGGDLQLSSEHLQFRWVGEKDLGGIEEEGSAHYEALLKYFASRRK